jgi:hypothetical protein
MLKFKQNEILVDCLSFSKEKIKLHHLRKVPNVLVRNKKKNAKGQQKEEK